MFTEEDDRLIAERFAALMEACQHILHTDKDKAFLVDAFTFANRAHYGVRRRSGEPYIVHPLAVATIIAKEIGLGLKSIAASLLHDVVEDTDYTLEDIASRFGDKVAAMVDGLTKIKQVGDLAYSTSEQAENFRKMLYTLSDDVRVMIIKLADRLHNMRTLQSMPKEKQMKIVGETISIYAPLAHRLGLYAIKSELEDLSLKYSFPEDYKMIADKLAETAAGRKRFIDKFTAPVIEKLNDSEIKYQIYGREKTIYSIWKKMQRKQITIDEVYDLFAVRIVFEPVLYVPEKSQCWHIYSLITDIYKPKPDRIRDWVNIPKANGYEALHCTVMGPDGVWVEVQIRSTRMDEIAERGFAAHWKYKSGTNGEIQEKELDQWLREVRDALNRSTDDAVEFLDEFKLTLYASEIVVFTPKGETRTLPQGATALDFAYYIHSKVGNHAIGAKVNHKTVSIFSPIQSGDQVEILTSKTAEPKVEWLDHVVTAKAKQHIKYYIKKQQDNNIARGIEIFNEELAKHGVTPIARVFRKVVPAYGCKTKDEFYSKVGAGIISLDNLGRILKENTAQKLIKYWTFQVSNTIRKLGSGGGGKGGDGEEDIPEHDDQIFRVAECCYPIPGDEVIGFKEKDGTVTVHKKNCSVALDLAAKHGDRIVQTQWSSQKEISYLCHIRLKGMDRVGILLDVSQIITAQLGVNIRKLYIESHDAIFEGYISLYVRDIKDLNDLIAQVRKVKGVESVQRVESIQEVTI